MVIFAVLLCILCLCVTGLCLMLNRDSDNIHSGNKNSNEKMWDRMRHAGKTNGVLINTYINPVARGDMFRESMIYNWTEWLIEAGLPKPTVCNMSPTELENEERLVITVGSLWYGKPTKWFLALLSETECRDRKTFLELKGQHNECFGTDGGLLGVSFSPAIAQSLNQPHAYWIWHRQVEQKRPNTKTHKWSNNVYVWMCFTPHRTKICDRITKVGVHIKRSGEEGLDTCTDLSTRCGSLKIYQQNGDILLNIHQHSYKSENGAHMEIHRLTHPCIQGACVITEKSTDPIAEKALMDAGLLHAIWDGEVDTFKATIEEAKKNWITSAGKPYKVPKPTWI